MANYLLNLHKFEKVSSDRGGGVNVYKFDLKVPLLFPSVLGNKKTEYKYLEIKTNKKEDELFSATYWGRLYDGSGFNFLVPNYWNLCIPNDNKGFSVSNYNDKLTLFDEEKGSINLEVYRLPSLSIQITPKIIAVKGSKSLQLDIEPVKIREEITIKHVYFGEVKNVTKLHSIIFSRIKKGEKWTLKFHPDNNTYFKNFNGHKVLFIPENSLQEILTNQNNNSLNSLGNILAIIGVGVAVLILTLFLLFFLKMSKSRKK